MKAKWMYAAATAALLIGNGVAYAQTPAEKKQEPGATQQQPSTGAAQERQNTPSGGAATGASQRNESTQSESAEEKSQGNSKQSDTPKQSGARSSQSKDDASSAKSATNKNGKEGKSSAQSGASDSNKDSARTRDKDNGDRRASDKSDARQTSKDGDDDRRASGKSDERRTSKGSGDQQRTSEKAGAERDRIQVTERERTTIQKSIDVQKARVDIDIDVNVGAPVPRNVTLYPLPAAIIDVNPRWRNYRYVVVQDEIVIINPQTYVVVEVIPVSGNTQVRATRSNRSVQLSMQQRQRLITYARTECQTVLAEPSFQIGVGVRIPERIELCPFEDVIVQEVGVVRPYRYFVVQNQVVLVDPSDHTIVEVLR
jgi:hypothetical protein